MNKQQAWQEWATRVEDPIGGYYHPDVARSTHGRAFSAGWDAKAEQAPTEAKLDAFCAFIGSEPVENDGGWSLEVWNAAWAACLNSKETCNLCGAAVIENKQIDLIPQVPVR